MAGSVRLRWTETTTYLLSGPPIPACVPSVQCTFPDAMVAVPFGTVEGGWDWRPIERKALLQPIHPSHLPFATSFGWHGSGLALLSFGIPLLSLEASFLPLGTWHTSGTFTL